MTSVTNIWNFAVCVKVVQAEHAKSKGETTKDFILEKVILTLELLAYVFRLVGFFIFLCLGMYCCGLKISQN